MAFTVSVLVHMRKLKNFMKIRTRILMFIKGKILSENCKLITIGFLLFAVPFSVLCLSFELAESSEFSIKPSLTVAEEYNDNVFERRDLVKTDYITRALPGLALKHLAPFWDWDIAYNFDYRYYARNSRTDDNTHNLLAQGKIRLIDEFMFLDVNDSYKRVSLNVTRDYTQESLIANQSDSNTFSASPYLQFRPGTHATVKTGYIYTNVWYRDPTAIDKREHKGFVDAVYEYTAKLSFNADYAYTHQNSVNGFDEHAPYAGARYEYADKSFVFANGGYTWIRFKNRSAFNNPFWNAGITHTFEPYAVYFNAGVQYPEDPQSGVTKQTDYTVGINRNAARGTIGISVYYSKYDATNIDRTKKYGTGITGRYEITPKLAGNISFNAEQYDHSTGSYTRRFFVNPVLSYALPWDISVALNYTFVDYYSPGIYNDNYRVNRLVLEARKVF